MTGIISVHMTTILGSYALIAVRQGAFNNYVDKKRGEGVNRKFMLGHVTNGRNYVKCQQLSTQGRLGSKLGKIWSTLLLNDPLLQNATGKKGHLRPQFS